MGQVMVFRDVTELLKMEDQIRERSKMEAVVELAAGIAHDFNNLLTTINGYSDLLLQNTNPGEPSHDDLNEIKQAGQRAAVLTQQLLAFGHQQVLQPEVISLSEIAIEMQSTLPTLIGVHIKLKVQCDADLHNVEADPAGIEHVIMNLAINARDAMPTGGSITISIKNVTIDGEISIPMGNIQAGDYVLLSISDTGIGMDEEVLSHIFEPFFTTKGNKGTGLGLSTVFGTLRQSGCSVDVQSEPGKGTTFRIYLPRAETGTVVLDKASPPDQIGGTETILIVEDEYVLRRLLKRILETLGYSVLVAEHGNDALLAAENHPGTINLIITDVMMPEMGGHELVKRLSPLRPEMSVLYMSGYDQEVIIDQGLADIDSQFLVKPFLAVDIARKIREILDNPTQIH